MVACGLRRPSTSLLQLLLRCLARGPDPPHSLSSFTAAFSAAPLGSLPVIPLDRIRAAAARARPFVRRTPVLPLDGGRWLKLELQPTGSFKVRGFLAAALDLPEERRSRGLLTVSAGNAALACAYAASRLGVP